MDGLARCIVSRNMPSLAPVPTPRLTRCTHSSVTSGEMVRHCRRNISVPTLITMYVGSLEALNQAIVGPMPQYAYPDGTRLPSPDVEWPSSRYWARVASLSDWSSPTRVTDQANSSP